MIAYIDSSVLMRVVLQQPERLVQWGTLEQGISSRLLVVEAYRTLDQLWHRNQLTEDDLAEKRMLLAQFLPRLDLLDVDGTVLHVASQPLPTPLRTLDALHLATAMIYRSTTARDERFVFATHDRELARAATAMNFDVIG